VMRRKSRCDDLAHLQCFLSQNSPGYRTNLSPRPGNYFLTRHLCGCLMGADGPGVVRFFLVAGMKMA